MSGIIAFFVSPGDTAPQIHLKSMEIFLDVNLRFEVDFPVASKSFSSIFTLPKENGDDAL